MQTMMNPDRASVFDRLRRRWRPLLLAAVLLPWFVRLVELISPKGPELEVISRQIANAHTLFNLLCTLVWLPLMPWMVRLVTVLVPERPKTLTQR